MKTKVSEATGPALDWMVAKANQAAGLIKSDPRLDCMNYFTPTTNWEQGGPIIEREKLCIVPQYPSGWAATSDRAQDPIEVGPTPLIAVMRCYVASKLGDEVEVPEGL